MSGRAFRRSILPAAALCMPVLSACGDLLQEPDTGIATQVTVTAVSGDGQSGCPGLELESPLRVRLVSQNGQSTERLRVEWTVIEGAGSVEPRNSFTGADGVASATWILGPRPTRQRVVAEFGGETETFEAGFVMFCPLGG